MFYVTVIDGGVEGQQNPRSSGAVDIGQILFEPLVLCACVAIRHVVVEHNDVNGSSIDAVPGVVGDDAVRHFRWQEFSHGG